MTIPPNGVNPATGDQSQAPGGSKAVTGDQPPVNADLNAPLTKADLDAATAPLLEKIAAFERDAAARRRIDARGGKPASTGETVTSSAEGPDPSKIPDPATREWAIGMQRQEEARRRSEAEAAEREKANRTTNRLQELVDQHKPARAEMVKKLLLADSKVGTDGKVYHVAGDEWRPIEDVFRETIAQDIFKPASGANGTSTVQGAPPKIGQTDPMAATAAIKDPVERLARQNALRGANAAAPAPPHRAEG